MIKKKTAAPVARPGPDLFAAAPVLSMGDNPPFDKRIWQLCEATDDDVIVWCAVDGVAFALKPINPKELPLVRLAGQNCFYIPRPTNRRPDVWKLWSDKYKELTKL